MRLNLRAGTALFFGLTSFFFVSGEARGAVAPHRLSRVDVLRSNQQIRVRVQRGESQVHIRGLDLTFQLAGQAARSFSQTSEWEFRCERGRIRGEKTPGGQRLDVPEPLRIRSAAGMMRAGDKLYREDLLIYSEGSLCEVVNEVDLERYLDGLVNAEFSSKWAKEAVAAQVIAARTYAVYQIQKASLTQHFDLDSTEQDQVYDGFLKEDFRASKVVESTRGQVLMASRGLLHIPAYYHSTCGGMTELPEVVWGRKMPGYQRVKCPFCRVSPVFSWSLSLSAEELKAKLLSPQNAWLKTAKLLQARVIPEIPGFSNSRVKAVDTVWSVGSQTKTLSLLATDLRKWLGTRRMRSTTFELRTQPIGGSTLVQFQGRGNGHGVGMCQWGAKVMGERGYTSAAILKHYYPDAEIKKLW